MENKKIVFLDRDGTIIKYKEYLYKIADLEFLPQTISGLKKIQKLGYEFIVVSNQSGIARKYFSYNDVIQFNKEMTGRLSEHGIRILADYFCPHHPEITGECMCRKPKPGMVHTALNTFQIQPRQCIFIGDNDCDIELGKNLQGVTIHLKNENIAINAKPDYSAKNMEEAYRIIKNLDDRLCQTI